MQLRLFKLRFRRRFHRGQRQMEDFGEQAEAQLERHLFKRFSHLGGVWRFMAAWLLLLVLLGGIIVVQIEGLGNYYQTLQPIPGGTYTEGVLGEFTNANPIYATGEVDSTVSRLVFAGLFKHGSNNKLVGDLAKSWHVNSKGTTYTVKLRPNLTWQDGKPLTSADVAFTYHTIQNPDAQSPLNDDWQDITVAAPDADTITFKLPNPLSSFPYTLTNGIVPKHLLEHIPATDLRSADFNTLHPVGSGPFEWKALQVNHGSTENEDVQIALQPFPKYYAGAPKLHSFVVHAFVNKRQMISSYENGELTAIVGLDNVPKAIADNSASDVYSMLLNAETMVFFNTQNGVLKDAKVRQALVKGANVPAIINQLDYSTQPVHEPILMGQLGYDDHYAQAEYNATKAAKELTADGWQVGKDGLRSKGGQALSFDLFSPNTSEDGKVARLLQKQWRAIGVKMNIHLQNNNDFQATLSNRSSYDAVLYGISVGMDPDVFVYWDSSQADPRSAGLNLSLYQSKTADASLEAGRTRLNPALRVIKYRPFLQAWQQDAPALGLYQPRFLYITHGRVYGLSDHTVNTGTDRFDNVSNWMIRTAMVTNR